MGMLERDIQIRQNQPFGHQGDQVPHMRIGVDVMQPHPRAQLAQITGQRKNWEFLIPTVPIRAIGRGILTDDQKLLHPCLNQFFRLPQNGLCGTALQAAPHIGDDAKLALMIAALGNLEIAVMTGG